MTRTQVHTKVLVVNHQRHDPVPVRWLTRVAACAIARLRIRRRGWLSVALIDGSTMRRVHGRFLRHQTLTDVLTFRYEGRPQRGPLPKRAADAEPMLGEILIAPAAARSYTKGRQVTYHEELARYVVHGVLHWMGYDDHTPPQRRIMRALEDRVLASCAPPRLELTS